MVIGARLRSLRENKGFSQGEIEKRTGLLRCYISRVENGHTIPSLETLQRLAAALEVSLYELFYPGEGEAPRPSWPCGRPWKSFQHSLEKPGRKRAFYSRSSLC